MMHDHNGWIGHWPFRDLGEFGSLKHYREQMVECGISSAWVSPLEALYRIESESANEALAAQLDGDRQCELVPVFQPLSDHSLACLSVWEDRGVRSLRLTPAFHAYSLLAPRCLDFIAEAVQRDWRIVITIRLLDERSQPSAFPIPPVPVSELIELAARFPKAWLLGCGVRVAEIKSHATALQGAANLRFDLSHFDGGFGLEAVAELIGRERILFGSNYPLFYPVAAVVKQEVLSII